MKTYIELLRLMQNLFRKRISTALAFGMGLLLFTGCLRPVSSQSTVCVNFGLPLKLLTEYGQPAGHQAGKVIFTRDSVPVSVHPFVLESGRNIFNLAKIDLSPLGNQSIRTNNINLEFNFVNLSFKPSTIKLEFIDLGGYENISINGSKIFVGEIGTFPQTINRVNISSAIAKIQGGSKGTINLSGKIKSLRIGGQELWIESLCIYP